MATIAASEAVTEGRSATSALPASERPSVHLALLLLVTGLAVVGFAAVIFAGELRGYTPGLMFAARDLALYVPIFGVFVWLARAQRYRGSMTLFTAAIVLFTVGLVVQYRLFRDPEYNVANLTERREAREAKAQYIRYLNIRTGYDADKKAVMFGSPDAMPEKPPLRDLPVKERTLTDMLTSVNT